ncbi:MAG: M81 family metallopeptidase [Bacteroidales bacterium]|jgi:microcystin degradation protein MlrC|nr:M81 family metallopeptidase [Bacteroidales bacterium]
MKRPVLFILSVLILGSVFSCQTGSQQKRVLTLGIRHESNTFSTLPVAMSDFTVWRGADALKGQKWAEVLREAGMEVIPTLHAYAWPGGVVEQSAFETFMNEILDSIKNAGRLDGIYMDMHGALHAEGYDDAQVTLIRKIRELKGNDVLISGSFDLHGNLSPGFVEEIDLLTAYRTAPHRDAEETRVRAVELLIDALSSGWDPHIEFVEIPILVPGEKSITEVEPLNSIYSQIPVIAGREGLLDASIFAGYCWADLPRSAMRVFVVARDKKFSEAAKNEAAVLASQIWDSREKMVMDVPSGPADEMIDMAGAYAGKTVFISDSGDNTTAGAPGDNTQVLEALLRKGANNALVAGIVDPDALQECLNAGYGNIVKLSLGGKKDNVFCKPVDIEAKVFFLSPDSLMESARGAAVVETGGVKTVIISSRRSFTTLRDFEEVGLDPLDFGIVVVKLGYLFPELRDIAPVHLMALTSGFCNLDMRSLPFRNVRRPIYPLDPDMVWKPE